MPSFMHAYMGVFLTVCALLKLFDFIGVKSGFAKYDLLARTAHGLGYPFMEPGLDLANPCFVTPPPNYIITIVVFRFGAIGVINACVRGSISPVLHEQHPNARLSTVTLTEDLGMVIITGLLLAS